MKIIAVDFDGCLCGGKWPDIGAPRQQVINELIRQQAEGAKLILWSCREGEQLKAAVMWCLNHGLKFDAVNDNLEENKAYFGNNSRKIYATEYWDDKSVLVSNSENETTIVRREYQTGGLSMRPSDGMDEIRVTAPTPGKCPVCATKHDERDPHDKNSLYYQIRFFKANKRFPSWWDAMSHCTDMTKAVWVEKLKKRGIILKTPAKGGQDGQ